MAVSLLERKEATVMQVRKLYHITRTQLRAGRLRDIALGVQDLTDAEREEVIRDWDSSAMTDPEVLELLKRKYEDSPDPGGRVSKSSRYNRLRRCFYLSESREGVIAEAAYYLFIYNGRRVQHAERDYTIIEVEVCYDAIAIDAYYPREQIVCTHHPIRDTVERQAVTQMWRAISAASARHASSRNIATYDFDIVKEIKQIDWITLVYDRDHPTIKGLSRTGINVDTIISTFAGA